MKKRCVMVVAICVMGIISMTACKQEEAANPTQSTAVESTVSDKVPDPTTPELEVISVYNLEDGDKGIHKSMDAIDALDPNLLLNKLVEYKVVSENTEIVNFNEDGEKGNLELKGLDMSDNRTIVAVANTFIENYELYSIAITVDGKKLGDEIILDKDYKNTLK